MTTNRRLGGLGLLVFATLGCGSSSSSPEANDGATAQGGSAGVSAGAGAAGHAEAGGKGGASSGGGAGAGHGGSAGGAAGSSAGGGAGNAAGGSKGGTGGSAGSGAGGTGTSTGGSGAGATGGSKGDTGGGAAGGSKGDTGGSGAGSSTGGSGTSPGGSNAGGSGPAGALGVRVFFTDLTSGPNTGGQGDKGAFVTIYGRGFGASQGTATVTVGGGAVDNYPRWSDTLVTVQLGAAAKTGDIVVHAAAGDSDAAPFTVRAGAIYFVSAGGDDTAEGSFAKPWATIPNAKNSLQPGDIAYLGTSAADTLSQTTEENYNAALSMDMNDATSSGTADAPKALVAYPGASITIGDPDNLERGILAPGITGEFDYWVIAGLVLRGAVEGIDFEGGADGWRVVGNDISCPNGTGESGCVNGGSGTPTHLKFYGNDVHDAAANVSDSAITKYYHGIYFGSNHLEIGWNTVRDGKTCRGIQFHDTGGDNEFDLIVHDNVIHGTVCDGINFATVDPSQGPVEAYNNIIYSVGTGPDPVDGSSDYAGIYVAGETEAGPMGSGVVKVYNNTLFDCGSWISDSSASAFNNGGGNPDLTLLLENNIVYAKSGEAYVSPDSAASLVTGDHNLWFGGGAAPAGFSASVSADPLFVSAATFDFHLTGGSPAIDQGFATSDVTDFDGVPRPQGAAFDIGAYEFVK